MALARVASAQLTQNVTVTATIPQVLNLSINSAAVSLPLATSDYDSVTGLATKTASAATTLAVSSNRSWLVSVRSASTAFTFTASAGDSNPNKSCSDLSLKVSSGSTYGSVSTTNAALASGARGGTSETGNTFSVDYRLTSNLRNDPPGTYSLGLIYTLTSP